MRGKQNAPLFCSISKFHLQIFHFSLSFALLFAPLLSLALLILSLFIIPGQTFLRLVERQLLGNLALLTFILSSPQLASMISTTSVLTSADVASASTVQDLDVELDTKSHSDIVHSIPIEPKLMHSTSKTRNLRR
jgi:hypothetical protein